MARNLSADANGSRLIEDFVGMFNEGVSTAKQEGQRSSLNKAPEVVRVEKLIERISGAKDEDDDIQETTTAGNTRNLRCPVLNSNIERPVKNTACGHVYSLKGVITVLYQNNGIGDERRFPSSLDRVPHEFQARCPVVGCQHWISARGVRRDFDMELTQRQLQSAAARRDSMDPDADEIEVL